MIITPNKSDLFVEGEVVGNYRVEELIGRGGMALVYRARQVGTQRYCALKVIRPGLLADRKTVEHFVREARAAGRIGMHPHVVAVFEAGIAEKYGVPFIAMEHVEGQQLGAYIRKQGPRPLAEVAIFMEQIGEALEAAHAAGAIHRDLHPGNILVCIDYRGRQLLKVLDFGLVKFLDDILHTLTVAGTLNYSAPEQLGAKMRDDAAKCGFNIATQVSYGTDVWPFGLIAFELLTGLTAQDYWGSFVQFSTKAACEPREPPSLRAGDRAQLLPLGFDDWFGRCLAHDVADRWPSVHDAVTVLFDVLNGRPPSISDEETEVMGGDE